MWIFRAMEEENGLPKLGTTATTLGIRKGKDIIVDINGQVHRPTFLPGGTNGLSARQLSMNCLPLCFRSAWEGRTKRQRCGRFRNLIWELTSRPRRTRLPVEDGMFRLGRPEACRLTSSVAPFNRPDRNGELFEAEFGNGF
jgi:hypothetical protein